MMVQREDRACNLERSACRGIWSPVGTWCEDSCRMLWGSASFVDQGGKQICEKKNVLKPVGSRTRYQKNQKWSPPPPAKK